MSKYPVDGGLLEGAALDLEWLLSSPPLLEGNTLGGTTIADAAVGTSWLAAINTLSGGLRGLSYPLEKTGKSFRLGIYAECLMGAALAVLPGHTLLAARLPVRNAERTIGEYDFLLTTAAGDTLHIELAVKIYLVVEGLALGPGLQDALPLKLQVLRRQLALAHTEEGAARLPHGCGMILPMAWVRGWIFYAADLPVLQPQALAIDHQRGWWQNWGKDIPRCRVDSVWCVLPKMQWLAPRRADLACCAYDELLRRLDTYFQEQAAPLMVAEYAPLHEGGVELARGMLVSSTWPDPAALAALQASVAGVRG